MYFLGLEAFHAHELSCHLLFSCKLIRAGKIINLFLLLKADLCYLNT